MFSYKFYVRTDKKDALMLRLTNNRKKNRVRIRTPDNGGNSFGCNVAENEA